MHTISELGSGMGCSAILMHLYSGQNVVGDEVNEERFDASKQLLKKSPESSSHAHKD